MILPTLITASSTNDFDEQLMDTLNANEKNDKWIVKDIKFSTAYSGNDDVQYSALIIYDSNV